MDIRTFLAWAELVVGMVEGRMHRDLDLNNKNIDDVQSIDGGGGAVVFHDDLSLGTDGGVERTLNLYGTLAGAYISMGFNYIHLVGPVYGYIRGKGVSLVLQTYNATAADASRIIIREGLDIVDIDILNAVLDMNSQKIKNVLDPTLDQDAATKKYVDDNVGVSDHGDLTGLADDDHTQYLLISGARAMTGNLLFAKHQGKELCIDNRTSDPSSPSDGQIWLRTDL